MDKKKKKTTKPKKTKTTKPKKTIAMGSKESIIQKLYKTKAEIRQWEIDDANYWFSD
jgi:hypothetical protein